MSEPDEVEGLKRALREAREAGDISIEEFLEELKEAAAAARLQLRIRVTRSCTRSCRARAWKQEAAHFGVGFGRGVSRRRDWASI